MCIDCCSTLSRIKWTVDCSIIPEVCMCMHGCAARIVQDPAFKKLSTLTGELGVHAGI